MSDYFSDRENGPRARTVQEMTPTAWAGLVAIVQSLINSGAFGIRFPEKCSDGQAICGNNETSLGAAIQAEIHGLAWPLKTSWMDEDDFFSTRKPYTPPTLIALDFLEFVWRNVAMPVPGWHHEFHRHYHLTFDVDAGQALFTANVNRILARNELAYEMSDSGHIHRVLPAVIGEALHRTYFRTGERLLDVMLEESRAKFSDPDPLVRREGLERLWDCWERIKSLADADKKKSIETILNQSATEPTFRKLLDTEARVLTEIGNSQLLRHHEITQTPVVDVHHVDYLYHRLFAMIELVIRKNARPVQAG